MEKEEIEELKEEWRDIKKRWPVSNINLRRYYEKYPGWLIQKQKEGKGGVKVASIFIDTFRWEIMLGIVNVPKKDEYGKDLYRKEILVSKVKWKRLVGVPKDKKVLFEYAYSCYLSKERRENWEIYRLRKTPRKSSSEILATEKEVKEFRDELLTLIKTCPERIIRKQVEEKFGKLTDKIIKKLQTEVKSIYLTP